MWKTGTPCHINSQTHKANRIAKGLSAEDPDEQMGMFDTEDREKWRLESDMMSSAEIPASKSSRILLILILMRSDSSISKSSLLL